MKKMLLPNPSSGFFFYSKFLFLFITMFLLIPEKGISNLYFVPDNYTKIQIAIDAVQNGDTVIVRPGLYHETINFNGKTIVVGSLFLTTHDTSYISQTIISAAPQGPAVIFETGESPLLTGFTLQNGVGKQDGFARYGGGIYCDNSSPTLDHLVIWHNSTVSYSSVGGGLYFRNSSPVLKDCRIWNNESTKGGGIYCEQSNIIVTGTWFHNNFSMDAGGGIFFTNSNDPVIQRCTFTKNSAIYGGAVGGSHSNPLFDRVTCYQNNGFYGGALNLSDNSYFKLLNSILWMNSMHPEVINEIFIGNGANAILSAYNDILGTDTAVHGTGTVYWEEGNIEVYPEFNDTTTGNLDLTLKLGSPCIDTGTAFYVYFADTLVNITEFAGEAPDLGAYEYGYTVGTGKKPQIRKPEIKLSYTEDFCEIRFNSPVDGPLSFGIYNMNGIQVVPFKENQSLNSGVTRIPRNQLSAGIYILLLKCGSEIFTEKIIL